MSSSSSIMRSSSSSSSSSSSATKIGVLINKMGQTPIHSCIIAINSIKGNDYHHNIAHTALLLTTKNRKEIMKGQCQNAEGILIEYGNYPPDEPKAKIEEEDNIKNNLVIYRYEEKGGLRYYTNSIEFFLQKFCDVGYVTLDIDKDNQKSFKNLIDIMAPLSENKWIKENYNLTDLVFKKSQNCQDFVCHAIDILKPIYDVSYIKKGKKCSKDVNEQNIIPDCILKILNKYEK